MLSAVELHARLLAQGFSLRVRGEQLIVSPASLLSEQDRAEIGEHRDALIRAIDSVPSGCISPLVCGHGAGICGRVACIVEGEHDQYAEAMAIAQGPDNPHRVPDFGPRSTTRKGANDDAA